MSRPDDLGLVETTYAVSLLQSATYDWWKLVIRHLLLPDPITWDIFIKEFQMKFITDAYKETKWKQFMNLKQQNLIVVEYEKEFSHLNKYALEPVLTEAFPCRQFEDGLNEFIKRYITVVTSLQPMNCYQLV